MAGETPEAGWRKYVAEANVTAGLPPAPANPQPLSFGAPNVIPPDDLVERLPAAAADKLRLLRQRFDDQHAVIPEFEIVRQASLARVDAQNVLKRLTDPAGDGGFNLPPDDRRVTEATKALAKATADFERLRELQEVRTAAWRATSQAKAACEDWLKNGVPGGTTIEAIEIEPPKLVKGEGIIDAVENRRRRVRELRADLHRIASAPYPSKHVKAQMRAQIEALAQRGTPDVSMLIEHDGDIVWPEITVRSAIHSSPPGVAHAEMLDAVALVAWLHRDALIAALDREIATEADDGAALTHEQRQQAESQTMSDLLAIEREESFFVWQAQAQGLPVEHRADCSPLALLGLRLVTAPRAEPGPSSPGLSWPR